MYPISHLKTTIRLRFVRFQFLTVATMKMRDFRDLAQPCCFTGADRCFRGASIITLMMEAVRTPEMSVYSETTRHYIPEGSPSSHYTSSLSGYSGSSKIS
jgi:hypothetical protein